MISLRLHTAFVFLTLLLLLGLSEVVAQPVWQSGATATGTTAAAGSSISINAPSGTTSGDLLVVSLVYTGGTGVTPNIPTGWTLLRKTDNGTSHGIATYYRTATGGANDNISISPFNSGVNWSIGVSRILGANSAVPVLALSSNTGTGTSVTSPSVVATPAYSMVLSYHANASSGSFTPAAGTEERYDVARAASGPALMLATFTTSTGGATGARTATASSSAAWVSQQIVVLSGTASPLSGDWPVPLGVSEITVEAWGGGGGGGKGSGSSVGGGGGGGAYARQVIQVTPGWQYSFLVGAAGSGAGSSSNNTSGASAGIATISRISPTPSTVLFSVAGGSGGGTTSGGTGGAATTLPSGVTSDFFLSFSGGNGAVGGGGGAAGTSANGNPANANTGGIGGTLFGGNGGTLTPPSAQNGFGFAGGGAGNAGNSGNAGGSGAVGGVRVFYSVNNLELTSRPADAQINSRVAYTLARKNQSGLPITSGNLTINLSSSPSTSQTAFYASASGGSPITQTSIPDGQSQVTVYFTSGVAGDFLVTATTAIFPAVTDDIVFIPAPATRFRITETNGLTIGPKLRNIPFSVLLTLVDDFGNPITNIGGNTLITLTAEGGVVTDPPARLSFQSDLNAPVTVTLLEGQSSVLVQNILYKGLSAPAGFDVQITASGSGAGTGNGLSGVSNPFSVRGIELSVTPATTQLAADGVASTPVIVKLQGLNDDGSRYNIPNEPIRVSATGGYLLTGSTLIVTETVILTNSSGEIPLTFRANTVAGSVAIKAFCPGACPVEAIVTLVPGPTSLSQSVLGTSDYVIGGSGSASLAQSLITLRLRDQNGNAVTEPATVSFTSSLASGFSDVQSPEPGSYQTIMTPTESGTAQVGAIIGGSPVVATVPVAILPIPRFRSAATGNWNQSSTWQSIRPNGTTTNESDWEPASPRIPEVQSAQAISLSPLIRGTAASANPFQTTSHTVALPVGYQPGDLLLLFWTDAVTSSDITPPTSPDWVLLYSSISAGSRAAAYYRVVSESELPARTAVFSTSASERSSHLSMSIATGTYQGIPLAGTAATGTNNSPNPPELTVANPTSTLWIAASHSQGDDGGATPSAPLNYARLSSIMTGVGTNFGSNSDSYNAHSRTSLAVRTTPSGTEDPGVFTLSSSASWIANTVAVRGAAITTQPGSAYAEIRNAHTVTLTTDQPMDQVVVMEGGTLAFSGESALTGVGPFTLQDAGVLRITSVNGISASGATGNIRMDTRTFSSLADYTYAGTSAQVSGTGLPASVRNLTSTNTVGVTLTSDLTVTSRLSLPSGGIVSVDSLRILDLDGYAGSVPELETGRVVLKDGSRYRNLTVQRPILEQRRWIKGQKGWRMVSTPVATTYAQMFTGFVTQGFTGSGFPAYSANLMWWDETDGGTTLQGWRQPASISDSIAAGRGHFHYVFNGAARPAPDQAQSYADALPRTLTAIGRERAFTSWPITFSARDTAVQSGTTYIERKVADAGWNLVGNPTASTLDWDASGAWTKTNLSNTIYVWDSALGDFRVWNGTEGNLTSGLIAPMQAFWVKATAAEPALGMTSSAKTLGASTFRGKSDTEPSVPASVMRFDLGTGSQRAQTWLQFSDAGRLGFDRQDAFRLSSPDNSWVTLHTRAPAADAAPMHINHLPRRFAQALRLDLEVGAVKDRRPVSGAFTLSWSRNEAWDESIHVVLMDHQTRTAQELGESGSLTFDHATPMSFAAKTNGGESIELPASPVAGYDLLAKQSETAYSRDARFSLVISNERQDAYLPRTIGLDQNYPNPFNPSTAIRFHVPETQRVRIDIFDLLGRRVAVLVDADYAAGSHQVVWEAGTLAGGIYLYRMSTPSGVVTRKMSLLK